MAAVFLDLSLTVSQKRWACVLDPTLALSRFGLLLAKRLGEVMELWVARELWHILDNTHFYLQQPTFLLRDRATTATAANEQQQGLQEIICALQEWEQLRMETDPARQKYYWIGDSPVESFLPSDKEPEIIWRYERLSASLDRRLGSTDALASAYRDTAALAVTLDSAFVLTHLVEDPSGSVPPGLCSALESWGIPCEAVSPQHALVAMESDHLRQLIVHAGLAKLFWAGLRLAVMQLVVPAAATVSGVRFSPEIPFPEDEGSVDESRYDEPDFDPWQGARGFWYPI